MKLPCPAVFSLVFVSAVATAQVQEVALNQEIQPVLEKQSSYPIAGSHLLRAEELKIRQYLEAHPEVLSRTRLAKGSQWGFVVGNTATWWATDLTITTDSSEYQVQSTCQAVGVNSYIFVEDSLWEFGGNGRVTQNAVDSIRITFDSRTPADPNKGIYQTDVETFGDPPDVDSDPKIIILILNIKDGYTGTGGFVAGYFFSINEFADGAPAIGQHRSNEAEIYYVDANPLDLTTSSGLTSGMATTAHEFQHMIHWNFDSNEGTFVNEGCSEVAEVVCGYPIRDQSLYANETDVYLFQWRALDNVKVLNDYSRAARWTLYLWEQFSSDFLKFLVADPNNEINGINGALDSSGTARRFTDVFEDWLVANYVDDAAVDSRYDYTLTPLVKPVPVRTHFDPNVSTTSDTVSRLGGEYIKFAGGTDLSVTFTSSASGLVVKAVKKGGTTVVEDVTLGTAYAVPEFGTTYSEVTFVLINKDLTSDATYSYSATGTSQTSIEVAYDDGEPEGFLLLSPGDSILVYFDGIAGARLDSLRIAFRRAGTIQMGVWEFTGTFSPSPFGQNLIAPFGVVSTDSVSSVPYPIPYDNWVTVDVSSANVDASSDFAVSFLVGSDPSAPAVMISSEPDDANYHSFTYSQSSGNRWVLFTDPGTPGNVFKYVVRAYVRLTVTDVQEVVELLPSRFALLQNFPNPFNPNTNIEFELPKRTYVVLKIYDILGREVTTIAEGIKEAGTHHVQWDTGRYSSGVYYYRLQTDDFVHTKKMVLLR